MFSRIYNAIATRLPSTNSFATVASSSNPSQNQIRLMGVKEFVDNAIDSNKITVFSKSYCPYCKRTKSLFMEKFPDEDVQVYELDQRDDGSAIQEYLAEKTGQRTVPNVFINKKHVGGNDDTQAAFKKGTLAKLVAA